MSLVDPEVNVLGGLLANPKWIRHSNIDIKDFYIDEHIIIYYGMLKYYQESIKVGGEAFASAKVLERYLTDIVQGKSKKFLIKTIKRIYEIPNESGNVDWYTWVDAVNLVKRQGVDKKTVDKLRGVVNSFMADGSGSVSVKEQLSDLVSDLDFNGVNSGGVVLKKHGDKLLQDYKHRKLTTNDTRIVTGFPQLDHIASAKPGRFWIAAAYTGDGKSVFGRELAYAAFWQGKNVLLITGEMTEREVMEALVVRHSDVINGGPLNWRDLDDGGLTSKQELVFRESLNDIKTNKQFGNMYIWKPPGRSTISDIKARAIQYNNESPLDMIVFDYLTLFRPSTKGSYKWNKAEQIMELCEEVRDMALGFDDRGVFILGLHQVSRSGWEEAQKRGGYYVLKDLAESRGVEREAALVVFIYRDEELKNQNELKLSVAKNRFGKPDLRGWCAVEDFDHSKISTLIP